jgi:hypothetical protein
MSKFKSSLFAGAVALSAIASPVLASETDDWSTIGGWTIHVDHSTGNGCFMVGTYNTAQTVIRIGFNNTNNSSNFVIINPAWTSLEVGKVYPLQATFNGDATVSNWNARAIKMGTATALAVDFSTPSPDQALMIWGQRLGFRLQYQGQLIANLRLNGTAAAAAETIACNHAQLNTAVTTPAPKADPFAAGPVTPRPAPARKPVDPFAV